MQQLSPQDAQFLYIESGDNLTHVMSIGIYDPSTAPAGKVRFKDIISHVQSRLHTSPLFKRRLMRTPLEMDFPYWVDDEYFDIEYHIRHGRLPEPGDWRQFCIHIARYHSRPLNMDRPLWEMYVIEGLDNINGLPPGCYAIATKIHHATIDGASAVQFFSALNDIDTQGNPVVELPDKAQSFRRPGVAEVVSRATMNNMRSPWRMTNMLLRNSPTLYRAIQGNLVNRNASNRPTIPDTRFNGKVSPHKVFDAATFQLTDFKAIKNLVEGATINDVVLAVCSGGLHRYLNHHNELPTDPLVAWVPINARPKDNDKAADAPGNNISAMTASLHTDIEDPLLRLQAIRETTAESKEAKSGVSARLLTDLTQYLPAATQLAVARLVVQASLAPKVCNLFISNIPGPQFELYMNGARVTHSFGLAPLADGMGLFIATPSYNGQISFNVISTRDILPDIAFFTDCLKESFEELKAMAAPKKPAPRKRAATTTRRRTKAATPKTTDNTQAQKKSA